MSPHGTSNASQFCFDGFSSSFKELGFSKLYLLKRKGKISYPLLTMFAMPAALLAKFFGMMLFVKRKAPK